MKPFHLIAIPHKDILEGRLTMVVFAADLWEVYKGRAVEDYQNSEIFFKKTYLTAGLKNLLNVASKSLRGEGGDPVIQIQTPFGGGKTHALIALYHAFTNPDSVKPYFDKALKTNVVVIVGTALSPKEEYGRITGTLWEEIERQLEGKVEKMSQPIAPGRETLRELLEKHQPLLILMDEVLEYMAKAAGIKRGYTEFKVGDSNLAAQTIAFMQELTETVISDVFRDNSRIFKPPAKNRNEVFPLRIKLKPIKIFKNPIDFKSLIPKLKFITNKRKWTGHIQGKAMREIPKEDYELILSVAKGK